MMGEFDLTDEELKIVRDVLENYIADLRMEISHTDSMDFRETLKRKEEVLKNVLSKLGRQRA
jgi:hypothetical protein